MKLTKKIFATSAAVGIAAIGLAFIPVQDATAEKGEKEKCFGVAKAAANDCGSKLAGHSCAGQSATDGATDEFIIVPKGLCERLANGSNEPKPQS